MQKNLKIRFSIPGFHYWPDPPKRYDYLGQNHRHVFYWTIKFEIDKFREIEFIDTKDTIVGALHRKYENKEHGLYTHLNFGDMSCEEIAVETHGLIKKELDIECISIEVSEDKENGAEIIWR